MSAVETRVASLVARFDRLEKSIAEMSAALASLQSGSKSAASAAKKKSAPAGPPKPHERDTPAVTALKQWTYDKGLHSAEYLWVPSEYYQRPLQWREDVLHAPSSAHLCKTIVVENTHCTREDCSDRNNSRFYLLVFQYVDRFDAELVSRFLREKNPGVGKKKFNIRLADPQKSQELTGFSHGAVAPFGTPVDIPVLLSAGVTQLSPPVFYVGGGDVDCKCRLDTTEFVEVIQPLVAPITVPLTPEELENLMD